MIRVKICGVTAAEDAAWALAQGADALGLNFVPGTPRCLDPAAARAVSAALPPLGTRVGIFVDEAPERVESIAREVGLDVVQLHGAEPPEVCRWLGERGLRVIKALRVSGRETLDLAEDYSGFPLLLDAYVEGKLGGTGKTFDWSIARELAQKRDIILSGGLQPENVADAIRQVRPYGVDTSSGVEGGTPGRKDFAKVQAFIENARAAAAALPAEERKR
ncbi:MAG: phosphoribosylanthranilate isomerase [bacterium]|nr:phosphoribosylanthranilate isomerase [bacterium]